MAEEHSLFYLPEALEEEILVRLPVKSIIRFESVCKRWCSLFRSKSFSALYFGSGHHQVSIPTKAELLKIYPELRHRRRRHSGSSATSAIGPLSNGIYALTYVLTPDDYNHVLLHTLKIALFNPATLQMKLAPPFPNEYLPLITGISSHRCGISCGIDDDYRTVVVINYDSGGESVERSRLCFLVFLYTWRTGKWERLVDYNRRQKRIGLPASHVFQHTRSVLDERMACSQKLFNGCWHWMTLELQDGEERYGILSFDFSAKSFRLIPGPMCEYSPDADVFVLHHHLAAIVLDGYKSRCEIWMKTTGLQTRWTNVYKVNVGQNYLSLKAILHQVDYYPVQVSELIRIKRVILMDLYERFKFDETGLLVEDIKPSKEISYRVGGISNFTPTLEHLP